MNEVWYKAQVVIDGVLHESACWTGEDFACRELIRMVGFEHVKNFVLVIV